MPKRKPIPDFQSEEEGREFWATHDSSDYVDWGQARSAVYPSLKPSTETISLRLPASLLADLKILANRMDVPYQSLLKVYLADRVHVELGRGQTTEDLVEGVKRSNLHGEVPTGERVGREVW